ncbi:STAS domain-containing protein [Streptomyces sp. NPDC059506]|uniref:STAS domain-containing protein n=1 Tax=Streptomyces TaxID=1883 RepID=UPI0022AAA4C2|nr:STAS domain-containing protein [Streptomyces sp. HB2AG]MCZ2523512.1 STAS domain-containing protein [Streptomyces sp. HB2AG]
MDVHNQRLPGGAVLLVVRGHADQAAMDVLSDVIWQHTAGYRPTVLVDLRDVESIDRRALDPLLHAALRLYTSGGNIGLIAPSEPVRDVVARTGTAPLLPAYDDADCALKDLAERSPAHRR